ncbi:transglutaminase domain-containing protein [Candidatus Altiarchaeota archaeon]
MGNQVVSGGGREDHQDLPQQKPLRRWDVLDMDPSHFLAEGPLTKMTPAVRKLADSLPDVVKPSDMQAVVDRLLEFKVEKPGPEVLNHAYANRSADEIITSGKVLKGRTPAIPEPHGVFGCVDYATAFVAVARAKGIPAKFVRSNTHSYAHFHLAGQWYEAETSPASFVDDDDDAISKNVLRLTETRARENQVAAGHRAHREGLDPMDIGMKSINDYFICAPGRKDQLLDYRDK